MCVWVCMCTFYHIWSPYDHRPFQKWIPSLASKVNGCFPTGMVMNPWIHRDFYINGLVFTGKSEPETMVVTIKYGGFPVKMFP